MPSAFHSVIVLTFLLPSWFPLFLSPKMKNILCNETFEPELTVEFIWCQDPLVDFEALISQYHVPKSSGNPLIKVMNLTVIRLMVCRGRFHQSGKVSTTCVHLGFHAMSLLPCSRKPSLPRKIN